MRLWRNISDACDSCDDETRIRPVQHALSILFLCGRNGKRSQASYGIMSFATLENVIRRTLEFAEGSCTIAFQGGEPTLAGLDFFRECIRLEQKYNTKNVTISHALQTNGYALNEEWCQFLQKSFPDRSFCGWNQGDA